MLRAQAPRELRVEAGAAQVRQLNRDSRAAGVVGALFRATDTRYAAITSVSVTFAGDSATAAQGIAALAWRSHAASRWTTEGGVSGAAFGVYELGRGASTDAYVRERVTVEDLSLWVGGAAGRTRRDGFVSHSTAVDGGVAIHRGDLDVSLALGRVHTSDWALLDASQIFLTRAASAYDLFDRTLTLRYSPGPVTFALAQSWRSGQLATTASQSALVGSADLTITPRVSVLVSGGRQLADPLRGTPDARILSLVLRVLALPWRLFEAPDVTTRAFASVAPGPDGVLLTIRVVAPDSQRVEVAGSFSGWEPLPLRRTADGWEAQVTLGSGRHRVAVRIDGGVWKAPSNLGAVRDEFGGSAGLVVVP